MHAVDVQTYFRVFEQAVGVGFRPFVGPRLHPFFCSHLLDHTLVNHRIGDLDKTSDVGALNVVH